jgi:hypothetical protein
MSEGRLKRMTVRSAGTALAVGFTLLLLCLVPSGVTGGPGPSSFAGLTEVGRLAGPPYRGYHTIHASGDLVFCLVNQPGMLEIVDVSDPANPYVRSSLNLFSGDGHDLWYGEWGTNKYVFTGHRWGRLTMSDVTNPDVPVVSHSVNTIYHHKGLYSVGHYVYYCEHPASATQGGLRIYDFATGSLVETGNWLKGPPCPIDGKEIAVRSDGSVAYQYDEEHRDWVGHLCSGINEKLLAYDTTVRSAPTVLGYLAPPVPRGGAPRDWCDMVLSPDDDYLYLAYGGGGVLVCDASGFGAPSVVAQFGAELDEVALDPARSVLYAATAPPTYGSGMPSGSSLWVVGVWDPSSPSVIGTMPGMAVRDLWLDGDYLYTTSPEAKLIIYEAYQPVIEVSVDVKPGACPNPLNVKSRGVIPVAIAGTKEFDASQIDPDSVLLEGVAPLRWSVEDVTTPYEPFMGKEECSECATEGPDGRPDLTLKFKTQDIVVALGEVSDGDCRLLTLTGALKEEFGGVPMAGEDLVVVLRKGKD